MKSSSYKCLNEATAQHTRSKMDRNYCQTQRHLFIAHILLYNDIAIKAPSPPVGATSANPINFESQ